MDIDSIGHRHGRAFHLPLELSNLGHNVTSVVIDYRTSGPVFSYTEGAASWVVVPMLYRWLHIPRLLRYFNIIRHELKKNAPDVIIAGSDAANVVAGFMLSKITKTKFISDVKDDYSTFAMTKRIPLLEVLYYYALRNADAVSCVSDELIDFLKAKHVNQTFLVENAVSESFNKHATKEDSRKKLGLPKDKFLIGTAGSLRNDRNIGTLLLAFRELINARPDIGFVVAGPRDDDFKFSERDSFYDLGIIPPNEVDCLFSALDLGIILGSNSNFCNRCFPQKYNEMLACGLPIGAANVGVFSKNPAPPGVAFVFTPNSHLDLAQKIIEFERFGNTAINTNTPKYWSNQAKVIEKHVIRFWR